VTGTDCRERDVDCVLMRRDQTIETTYGGRPADQHRLPRRVVRAAAAECRRPDLDHRGRSR